MKFIKDIIGEQRERIARDTGGDGAFDPAQATYDAPPEAQAAPAPLQLNPSARVGAADAAQLEALDQILNGTPDGQDMPEEAASTPAETQDPFADLEALSAISKAARTPQGAQQAQPAGEVTDDDTDDDTGARIRAAMFAEPAPEPAAGTAQAERPAAPKSASPEAASPEDTDPEAADARAFKTFSRRRPAPDHALPEQAPVQEQAQAEVQAQVEAEHAHTMVQPQAPRPDTAPPHAGGVEAGEVDVPAPVAGRGAMGAQPVSAHAAAAQPAAAASLRGRPAPEHMQAPATPAPQAEPHPAPAPAGGRVKTRLLGFSPEQARKADPFHADRPEDHAPSQAPYTEFPVGWLVILQGPGRGAGFTLYSGVTVIGRGADQTLRLDFGDTSISREMHAAIAYDPEQQQFFLGHGGKANLVRLNNKPVLSTETLSSGDVIRIGETTLRFVAFCGEGFDWNNS